MRRWALMGGLSLVLSAPGASQNTVRWNDVVRSLDELGSEPPAVHLWLDRRMVTWGEGIRVGFRVDEDAFVVVARVDGEGRLTLLHPSGRTRVTEVRAGTDTYVRSARLGNLASFVPGDRPGNTGFVFALASRSPMDLSRLRYSDFSAWVTGVPRAQPASRYFGDPYRVVQRFARLVSYSENTEFDWDFEYYSVDYPSFVSTASSFCGAFRPGGRLGFGSSFGMLGYEYDPYSYNIGCQSFYDCVMPALGGFWWNGIPSFFGWSGWGARGFGCGGNFGTTQVASNPVPTTPPPPLDTPPVNPWVPGAIDRPNLDKSGGGGSTNGPHIMTDRPTPAPGAWNDRDDLSFSIPSRALRGLRGASREEGSVPLSGPGANASGPMPMPSRPAIEMASEPQIEWVRPPRSFDAPPRDPVDRMPSLGGRRTALGRSEEAPPPREYGPPPRMGSPMFDREPGRNSAFDPTIRNLGGATYSGGSMYSPPNFGNEGRPATNPGITTGGSGVYAPGTLSTGGSSGTGSSGSGTSSPPASGSTGSSGSSSSASSSSSGSTERKPHQK